MIRRGLELGHKALLRALVGADAWPAGVWPASHELRERAEELGLRASPRASGPGEAWLIAARPGNPIGSLWRLGTSGSSSAAHFVGDAATSLALARRVTLRDLSILTGRVERAVHWRAERGVNTDDERALLGTSFGLAFCLGHASSLLGISVPEDILASAEVRPDGTLAPVGYLDAKVACLVEHALGVGRFFVAEEQAVEARGLLAKHDDALRGREVVVVGLASVKDAFRQAFKDIKDTLLARWESDPETASAAVADLWRATVQRRGTLLGWEGVQAAAEQLEVTLRRANNDAAARRAAVVAKIARRHQNQRGILLDFPDHGELAAMSRPIRTEYLAHVVQSAADHEGDARTAQAYVEKIRVDLTPSECHAEDLKLRGAIGRAMARYRTAAECERWQRDTVEGWFAIDHGHEASFAMSAWFQVCEDPASGVDLSVVDQMVRRFDDDPRADDLSRAYARVGAARLSVQRTGGERALGWLNPAAGFNVEEHLPGEALRWRARALDIVGRLADADAERERLKGIVSRLGDARDQAHLADLDAALRDGDAAQWTSAIRRLIEDGGEGTRLQAELAIDTGRDVPAEAAKRFRDRYRY